MIKYITNPITLVLMLLALMIISLGIGKYPITISEILSGLLLTSESGNSELIERLIYEVRLPRVLAAVIIGMALAVSGAAFQSMFMNPLVSPGILGVLAGASFGAALGMVISDHWFMVQILAFVFGSSAVGLALLIGGTKKGNALVLMILGGIISGALFSALLSVVKYVSDPYNDLPAIVFWLMGSLASVEKNTVWMLAIPMIGGSILLMLLARPLNALSMGEEEAKSLGVPVKTVRILVISIATLISTLTVVIGGMIGWVGLVIPHIARLLVGSDNRKLLPVAGILGAIYLLLIDNISRLAFTVEIPIGILTALIGIPFFAWALKNVKKGWN